MAWCWTGKSLPEPFGEWHYSLTHIDTSLRAASMWRPAYDCLISAIGFPILISCIFILNQGPGLHWVSARPWPWWRHLMETLSALLVLCAGNSPVTGEFPSQRPVTQSFDVFFDLRLNKQLSRKAGDLRLHRAHYDVTVMLWWESPISYDIKSAESAEIVSRCIVVFNHWGNSCFSEPVWHKHWRQYEISFKIFCWVKIMGHW